MEHLAEFLDVLEPPLQIAKPNKYKIIQLDIPIVKYTDPRSGEVLDEAVFCADILDIITQDFFARKSQSSLMDEQTQHVEEVKVWTFMLIFRILYKYVHIGFWLKINVLKAPSHQKLGIILENKVWKSDLDSFGYWKVRDHPLMMFDFFDPPCPFFDSSPL